MGSGLVGPWPAFVNISPIPVRRATIWLAAQRGVACNGVVLVSPLASGARTFCNLNGLPSAVTHWADGFFADSIERVGHIEQPVMIVHGTKDDIVPVQNAHDLYENLADLPEYMESPHRQHKLLLLPAGHNDIEILFGSEYVRAVLEFMHDNVTCDIKQ